MVLHAITMQLTWGLCLYRTRYVACATKYQDILSVGHSALALIYLVFCLWTQLFRYTVNT